MNIIAILSFISVIVLATVTFIFIYNTRSRIVEMKQDIKNNNLLIRNNITKVSNDSYFNDQVLNSKIGEHDSHTHTALGAPPSVVIDSTQTQQTQQTQ